MIIVAAFPINAHLAFRKKRSFVVVLLLTVVLSWLMTIALLVLPPGKRSSRSDGHQVNAPNSRSVNQVINPSGQSPGRDEQRYTVTNFTQVKRFSDLALGTHLVITSANDAHTLIAISTN